MCSKPLYSIDKYLELWNKAKSNDYPEVEIYEKECSYNIDKDWLDDLAKQTQIVIKNSELCYAHGRVLYSTIRKYADGIPPNKRLDKINIFETGTARGFSSICMAKALYDANLNGNITTFDVLPHYSKMYWNSISDHYDGEVTRHQLLKKWNNLVKNYIIFHECSTRIELQKVKVDRVHIAYLDGAHTYDDIIFEFNCIKSYQHKGDLIIYDDYSVELFPGIVQAVDEICDFYIYSKRIIYSNDQRSYVVAQKM